jgi:murein DD-endopeptidase MepM/ murein hydrolase activator NlpD
MRLGLWPNLKRNRRPHASPPVRGPFRLTCAERYSTGKPHWAMDIAPAVWRWAPVRAVRNGVVLDRADGAPDNPPGRYPGMPSNWVIIGWENSKGEKRSAYYQHLKKNSVRVKKGQKVKAGQILGRMGTSGNTSGLHLHFSVHKGWIDASQRYNQMTDPHRVWPPSKVWLKPKSRR